MAVDGCSHGWHQPPRLATRRVCPAIRTVQQRRQPCLTEGKVGGRGARKIRTQGHVQSVQQPCRQLVVAAWVLHHSVRVAGGIGQQLGEHTAAGAAGVATGGARGVCKKRSHGASIVVVSHGQQRRRHTGGGVAGGIRTA